MPKAAVSSMYKEMLQLHNKTVLKPVLPSFKLQKKAIRSFLFLKEKRTSDGLFDKLMSRLVAGGDMQDKSALLYENIYSPTACLSHLFIVA
jgi:hypothetical protein